ncbi:sensor histidine kinase [Clostridium amazonitimonense]|uniref:sensor histidine kinase n=1 Tax=Clostridium amazonitimonense TaxID=1499689 RepID=UPI000509D489|nr:HAMP domain-containing sensor histidine kinase [Clostridium amazonitimonense]
MKVTLIIIIITLIVIICIQYVKNSKTSKDIKYIRETLQHIVEKGSTERIKLFTSDDEMKQLLTAINKLLDYNNNNITKYNKAKISMKKMLSNISHDLKTPLTVILGYVEMLKLKSEEKVMADKIYEKAEEVLDLINKFFDLARIESGDKKIQISKVNICEICRTTILNFYDTLQVENMEVLIDIPEKDIFVLGNEEAIIRILNNLIFNAIRYGGSGKYLGLVISDEETFAHIKVIDKGKGIEEKYKEEVFERIFTLEDSRSKSYQGSGLGLTITKSLVEALGGTIHVNSLPNVKTTFSFTLNKLNY